MPIVPKLSTTLITFSAEDPGGWGHLVERAKAADRAGLDRLAMPDHVVFGENLEAYSDPKSGGTVGGRQPTGPDGHWLEPLATIAHLTAVTERIRFITGILIAALRRPAVLAKSAATIDVLSGGRLDLGVGVGWQREEYEAAGLDYRDRGAQLNHTLEVCQTLWREQRAEHSSDRLQFSGIHQMPKPSRAGGGPDRHLRTAQRRDRMGRRPRLVARESPLPRRLRPHWLLASPCLRTGAHPRAPRHQEGNQGCDRSHSRRRAPASTWSR